MCDKGLAKHMNHRPNCWVLTLSFNLHCHITRTCRNETLTPQVEVLDVSNFPNGWLAVSSGSKSKSKSGKAFLSSRWTFARHWKREFYIVLNMDVAPCFLLKHREGSAIKVRRPSSWKIKDFTNIFLAGLFTWTNFCCVFSSFLLSSFPQVRYEV